MDGEVVFCKKCDGDIVIDSRNVPGAGDAFGALAILDVARGKLAFSRASARVKMALLGAGIMFYGFVAFMAGHAIGEGLFWALGLIIRKLMRTTGVGW